MCKVTLLIKKVSTDFKDIIQKNIIKNHGLHFFYIHNNIIIKILLYNVLYKKNDYLLCFTLFRKYIYIQLSFF